MSSQRAFLIIFSAFLQITCESKKDEPVTSYFKPPKVVEAKTYKASPSHSLPPTIIPVTGLTKTIAGKPEIVPLKINRYAAKPQRVLPAGSPTLRIPAGDSYRLPKVVPSSDSPFRAAHPEIILLKDFFGKENNPGNFSSIKAIHGLRSNEISSLCQDQDGNLWIGEWLGGVSKYDGRYLTNYSVAQGLSSDDVNSILPDKKGNIWMATTEMGVNKFDGKYITRYAEQQGLGSNFVWDMIEDKNGDIWFASDTIVTRYDGHSFTHYTASQGLDDNGVLSLLEDSKGNLWAGGTGGLSKFDGKSFIHYTPSIQLNDSAEVLSIVEDNEGNIWFATNYYGLFKFDGKMISQYTFEGGLSSNRLTRIAKDKYGDLWIGTWGYGVNRYDGKYFIRYGIEEGLGNEQVTAVFQDKSDNLWLATTAGLSKYDGKSFSNIIPLRQGEVECLLADRNPISGSERVQAAV